MNQSVEQYFKRKELKNSSRYFEEDIPTKSIEEKLKSRNISPHPKKDLKYYTIQLNNSQDSYDSKDAKMK